MVVTQWGCWNNYYVAPNYNTLAHGFLVSGEQGAAAVLGATSLSYSTSEERLGAELMPLLLTPNVTIGEAVQQAKANLAAAGQSDLDDVILGWTLLGDPALVISD